MLAAVTTIRDIAVGEQLFVKYWQDEVSCAGWASGSDGCSDGGDGNGSSGDSGGMSICSSGGVSSGSGISRGRAAWMPAPKHRDSQARMALP